MSATFSSPVLFCRPPKWQRAGRALIRAAGASARASAHQSPITHHHSPVPPALRPEARALHQLCTWIARAVQAGRGQGKMVRRLARKHNGRPLANGRTLRLSPRTLANHYRAWLTHGRSAAAWPWRYCNPAAQPIRPAQKQAFLRLCLAPGVESMQAAYRLLSARAAGRLRSYRSFHRILSPRERAAVRALHRARAQARAAETALQLIRKL